MKLRGRAEAPALGAEGAQFPSARGANTEAPHGPLQRLLEDALIEATVRAHQCERKPKPRALARSDALATTTARAGNDLDRRFFARGLRRSDSAISRSFLAAASNGEAEGPRRSPSYWRRGRTISQRPRRQHRSPSRTPPAIVRRRRPPMRHSAVPLRCRIRRKKNRSLRFGVVRIRPSDAPILAHRGHLS